MSRTLDDESDPGSVSVNRTFQEFATMLASGRSFSGHERNCAFLNPGKTLKTQGGFANISASSGFDLPDDARGISSVDWDHDGDLDVWVSNRNGPRVRYFQNDASGSGAFVMVRLTGDGVSANRDAIGARIEVVTDDASGGRRVKTLRAGEGHLSQSSKWVHFGLGQSEEIKHVQVWWPVKGAAPNGGERFAGARINGRFELVQGSGVARSVPSERPTIALTTDPAVVPPESFATRIPLVSQPLLPPLTFAEYDGRARPLTLTPDTFLLINVWASWCSPCVAELKEFSRRAKALQAGGIDVLALSVNGLGADESKPADAQALLSTLAFPFDSAQATEQSLRFLQEFHDQFVAQREPLPVPTSFLLNPEGRVVSIYKGPLSVDDLIRDLEFSRAALVERLSRVALRPGRWVEHNRDTYRDKVLEKRARYGDLLAQMGFLDEAEREQLKIIQHNPDYADAHNNLAVVYGRRQQYEKMEQRLLEALRIWPDYPEARNNLALLKIRQEEWAQAAEHLQAVLRVRPHWPDSNANLGWVLMHLGRLAEAETHLSMALEGDANLHRARFYYGQVVGRRGQLEEAARQFEMILKNDPNNPQVEENLQAVRAVIEKRTKRPIPPATD